MDVVEYIYCGICRSKSSKCVDKLIKISQTGPDLRLLWDVDQDGVNNISGTFLLPTYNSCCIPPPINHWNYII